MMGGGALALSLYPGHRRSFLFSTR